MSTGTVSAAERPALQKQANQWRQLRFALLAGVAVAVILITTLGAAPATFTDVKAGIATGRVDEVRIVGGLSPQSTGYAHVVMFWRDQGRQRYAEVVQQSDIAAPPPAQFPETEHVIGSIEEPLRALGGDGMRIVKTESSPSGFTVAGWQVPRWLGWMILLIWLGALLLLRRGADPWWGTKWAWFWALLSPLSLLTVPAFLLLSGPPPGVPQYSEPGRRLSGGWAFLLVGALSSAIPPMVMRR